MASIVNSLPHEIWHTIYQFIPQPEEARLYAVNSALFNIDMSARYNRISIPSNPAVLDAGVDATLHTLSNPLITRHVNHIDLKPFIFCLTVPCPAPKLKLLPRSLLDGLAAWSFDLPNLVSCTFSSQTKGTLLARSYCDWIMVLKPPTQGVLLGTCQTLRVLNLEVPLEVYRDAVVPGDLFCPLLEELKIQVYTLYLTTNHENVLELTVAPLINRHSRTLTTLHLVDSRGPYRYLFYRYERLFRALTVFPRLSALSVHFLVYPIESRCLDALGRFIHLHHSSLHTLNLNLYHTLLWNYDFHVMRHHRLYDSSSLFRHGLFTRALPECSALTQLELVLLARDAFETGSAPLLSWFPTLQCTAKLTTLSLPYNTLTQSNLISLLNSTDLSSLRSLRVETRSFNMDLFDALAVTLHRLQDLRVDSHGLLDVDEDSGEEKEWTPLNVLSPDEPFLLELQARSYSHWCSLNRLRLVMIDQRKAYQHLKFEKVYWLKEGQVRHTFVHVRDFEATILPT